MLFGGEGRDRLEGGAGDDVYLLDDGRAFTRDVVVEAVDGGNDTVLTIVSIRQLWANVENVTLADFGIRKALVADLDYPRSFNDFDLNVIGNTAANRLTGNFGDNRLAGGAGNDRLVGLEGNDALGGGAGDDNLAGGIGDDVMNGGFGNDRMSGAEGSDILFGGEDSDILTGGEGSDLFVFSSPSDSGAIFWDRIGDFSADDVIDLSDIEAVQGDATSEFGLNSESTRLTGVAGERVTVVAGSNTWVSGDTNGDGKADLRFCLTGFTAGIAGDMFIL